MKALIKNQVVIEIIEIVGSDQAVFPPDEFTVADIPYEMERYVRPGWRYIDGIFGVDDKSMQDLQVDLSQAAKMTAEDTRYAIASPVGMSEISVWLMNYVGVALHQAGMPTPMWDKALAVESTLTGETVDVLRQTHIVRAGDYHALAALTQGFARQAKSAFGGVDKLDEVIAVAGNLREKAMAAQADPAAAIAQVMGE